MNTRRQLCPHGRAISHGSLHRRVYVLSFTTLLLSCTRPPELPVRFAPAGMNPSGRYAINAEGGVTFRGDGSLRLRLYMQKGPLLLTIRAGGEVSRAGVSIDGQAVGTRAIASEGVADYPIEVQLDRAGTKVIDIAFGSEIAGEKVPAGGGLYVQSISIRQGT